MMQRCAAAALVVAATAVGLGMAADDSRKDLIVGKWEAKTDKGLAYGYEFKKDGSASLLTPGAKAWTSAKYRWVDDKSVEIAVGGAKLKYEVSSVTKTELSLKSGKGKMEKLTRPGS